MWDNLKWVALIPVGLFLLYVAARFLFVAYFQSKKDFLKSQDKKK